MSTCPPGTKSTQRNHHPTHVGISFQFTCRTRESRGPPHPDAQSLVETSGSMGSVFGTSRFYGVGRHISFVGAKIASFTNIIPMMYRSLGDDFSYQDLLVFGEDEFKEEVYQELLWSCSRKKSQTHTDAIQFDEVLKNGAENAFESSLTESEAKILADYKKEEQHPVYGLICSLNQRPAAGRGVSSKSKTMYTLIANPSLHFLTKQKRWLLPSELLILQGFPVLARFSQPGGTKKPACSFAAAPQLPARRRLDTLKQAGNSMQVPVIGATMLYVLIFHLW